MQLELFETAPQGQLSIPDGEVYYWPGYFSKVQADRWFEYLLSNIQWQQDNIKLFDRWSQIPRLHAWYGESGKETEYSGLRLKPKAWLPELLDIKAQCERKMSECQMAVQYNSVLANLYRNGQDCVGWHSDNESEYGDQPNIASVTLGASRDFDMRHNVTQEKFRITLQHGSLLVMAGDTQRNWQHCIPRRATLTEPRINLTFRHVFTDQM